MSLRATEQLLDPRSLPKPLPEDTPEELPEDLQIHSPQIARNPDLELPQLPLENIPLLISKSSKDEPGSYGTTFGPQKPPQAKARS